MVTAFAKSPLATSVRTLFTGENPQPQSTQGNSYGQVNSPKVRSEGRYKCGKCEKDFTTNHQAKEHMMDHDDASMAERRGSIEYDEETEREITSIAVAQEVKKPCYGRQNSGSIC